MKTTSMLSQLAKVKGVTLCTLLVGIVAGVVNAVQPVLLKKVLDNGIARVFEGENRLYGDC